MTDRIVVAPATYSKFDRANTRYPPDLSEDDYEYVRLTDHMEVGDIVPFGECAVEVTATDGGRATAARLLAYSDSRGDAYVSGHPLAVIRDPSWAGVLRRVTPVVPSEQVDE